MSYSRWAKTWPGGGDSWYIFLTQKDLFEIWPPTQSPTLNKADVIHLRDILNRVLENMEE